MNSPLLIRAGFDTVEIAIPATYPQDFYIHLTNAKALAVESRKPHPIQFNGQHFFVQATGGQGGYEFQIDTGPFGFQIKIRGASSKDPWSTHVKFRAHGLATKGLHALKYECDAFLAAIGARYNHENTRISRLDYALDFYASNLVVSAEEIIAHARMTKNQQLERISIGDRTTYLRIGKMPNRQVCIYNKSKAIVDMRDLVWRDIYSQILSSRGLKYFDKDIWRVEFRAGKDAIETYAKPRFYDAVLAIAEVMFVSLTTSVRWVTHGNDTNRSRWPTHQIWGLCEEHFRENFQSHAPVPISDRTRLQIAQEHISLLQAQSEGLTLTLAAAFEIEPNKMDNFVQAHFTEIGKSLSRRADLEDQLRTRQERHALMFGKFE